MVSDVRNPKASRFLGGFQTIFMGWPAWYGEAGKEKKSTGGSVFPVRPRGDPGGPGPVRSESGLAHRLNASITWG